MRNSLEEWCEPEDISVNEIDRRANIEHQNGRFPTMVYISCDLYRHLQNMVSGSAIYIPSARVQASAQSIMSIMTSCGHLNVQLVNRLRNFLKICCKEDFDAMVNKGIDPIFWNDEERQKVDKEFEDIVLEEDK